MTTTSPIKIEVPGSGDAEGIAAVLVETRLNAYRSDELDITEEDLSARFGGVDETVVVVRRWLNDGEKRRLWVVRDGPAVVGMCVAYHDENGGHVGAVYVLPLYQGRGIGKQLMQAALEWLGDAEDIALWAATYVPKPIEFYRRLGFIESGVTRQFALTHDKPMPLLQMIKRRGGPRPSP